jgi:hypothetical protein
VEPLEALGMVFKDKRSKPVLGSARGSLFWTVPVEAWYMERQKLLEPSWQ